MIIRILMQKAFLKTLLFCHKLNSQCLVSLYAYDIPLPIFPGGKMWPTANCAHWTLRLEEDMAWGIQVALCWFCCRAIVAASSSSFCSGTWQIRNVSFRKFHVEPCCFDSQSSALRKSRLFSAGITYAKRPLVFIFSSSQTPPRPKHPRHILTFLGREKWWGFYYPKKRGDFWWSHEDVVSPISIFDLSKKRRNSINAGSNRRAGKWKMQLDRKLGFYRKILLDFPTSLSESSAGEICSPRWIQIFLKNTSL